MISMTSKTRDASEIPAVIVSFCKIFMVLRHPHYYELVEVLQHLNSPEQDRTILHSAHLDLTDAVLRAQNLYHLALLDGVIN